MENEELIKEIITALYEKGHILTLWNTKDKQKQKEGWRLKNGQWSPWFLNLRTIGSSPRLFTKICYVMASMIAQYDLSLIVGIEMAGVPLVGGISATLHLAFNKMQAIGFTRPLPTKARTPLEALDIIKTSSISNQYGQKNYLEGELYDGATVGIVDDMATDIGSKIIARLLIIEEAKKRGVTIKCNKVFYLLNRNKENRQRAADFVNEKEKALYPAAIDLHYLIEFDDHIHFLKDIMKPEEYEVISEYQKSADKFQKEDVRQKIINKW
ncbi:MAG: hypothetical protein L3V56_00425 [Candidatus Magnetoovum sp. WYHC-5]|nr:hypothetical protein [Candidatus Magnetoovum sp. WYHC-5]